MDPVQFRCDAWQAISSQIFDLLIIGGGITGAGIARDAALRGLKVALVEKGDFASGTSSKSSKLIHGGLRYLEQFQFKLVFESLQERKLLVKLAPHLVRPLPFLFPLYQDQSPNPFLLNCGLWLYDLLSGFSAPKHHRMYNAKQLPLLEPTLKLDQLKSSALYYDHQTDDARLTLENILDASILGATVLSYVKAQSVRRRVSAQKGEEVTFSVIDLEDMLSPATTTVTARVIIQATGPWTDQALQSFSRSAPSPHHSLLRPTKGVHVVLDALRLPIRHAVVMKAPKDGRVVFALPWPEPTNVKGNRTILGTTDTDFDGTPDEVFADHADIQYLLTCANAYFPQAQLKDNDVLSTWAGLRPLIAPTEPKVSESHVSREHQIIQQPGWITVAGGKLTTYRRMAREAVDVAIEQLGMSIKKYPCTTHKRFFPGAHAASKQAVDKKNLRIQARQQGFSSSTLQHLEASYGTRMYDLLAMLPALPPGYNDLLNEELPYCMAEVDFAMRSEMVYRLEDVLGRRLQVLLRAKDQGLSCVEAVAHRMALFLKWDAHQIKEEIERYKQVLQKSCRYQQRHDLDKIEEKLVR